MKRVTLCTLVLLSSTLLFAGTVRIWVFGIPGIATETDKQSAMSEASDQAIQNANGLCMGSVINTAVTTSGCFHFGSDEDGNWVCTVSAKAFCEIQTAH
jgi:hypothetical protein